MDASQHLRLRLGPKLVGKFVYIKPPVLRYIARPQVQCGQQMLLYPGCHNVDSPFLHEPRLRISAVGADVSNVQTDTTAIRANTAMIPSIRHGIEVLVREMDNLRLQLSTTSQKDTRAHRTSIILQRFLNESTRHAETVSNAIEDDGDDKDAIESLASFQAYAETVVDEAEYDEHARDVPATEVEQQTVQKAAETATESMGGITQAGEDAGEVAATGDTARDEVPADRVFVTVDGHELDITELSIDAAYLDALPNELRREVIMQQYTARGEQAQEQQGANCCHSQDTGTPASDMILHHRGVTTELRSESAEVELLRHSSRAEPSRPFSNVTEPQVPEPHRDLSNTASTLQSQMPASLSPSQMSRPSRPFPGLTLDTQSQVPEPGRLYSSALNTQSQVPESGSMSAQNPQPQEPIRTNDAFPTSASGDGSSRMWEIRHTPGGMAYLVDYKSMTTSGLPGNEVEIRHTPEGRAYLVDRGSLHLKWLPQSEMGGREQGEREENEAVSWRTPSTPLSTESYSPSRIDERAIEAAADLRERLTPRERIELGQKLEIAVRGKKSLTKRLKGSDSWFSNEVGSFLEIMALLNMGADPAHTSKDGESDILDIEIYNAGRLNVIELLLRYGAMPHDRALCSAAISGRSENVELLLGYGASVNARDEKGWTALVCAAGHGWPDVVETLLIHGAEVDGGDLGSLVRSWWGRMRFDVSQSTRYEIGALLTRYYEQQQATLRNYPYRR